MEKKHQSSLRRACRQAGGVQRRGNLNRFYIPSDQIDTNEQIATLAGDEYKHAAKTLRLKPQDEVELFDGEGGLYQSRIQDEEGKSFKLKLESFINQPLSYELHIFLAAPKGKKIDFIVKAITEVGATSITTFESRYTVAKDTKEKASRLTKIAIEACKQSKRLHIPAIKTGISFTDMLLMVKEAQKTIVFYEKAKHFIDLKDLKANKLSLVIGSEGGFAEEEIERLDNAGAKTSLLSDSILRVETAAISAAHLARFAQLSLELKN